MKKEMNEGMRKVMLMMLMASGNDIIAPKKLKRAAIKALELEDNSNFTDVEKALNQAENQDEKLTIVKGLILTHLTPSQMISLHDVIHTGVHANLKYLNDHPEEKGEASDLETIMKRLFESD